MHFSARTFMAYNLHQFSAVVQKIHVLCAFWNKFELQLLKNQNHNFKKLLKGLHFLKGLFGTNLLSSITTKVLKNHHIQCTFQLGEHFNLLFVFVYGIVNRKIMCKYNCQRAKKGSRKLIFSAKKKQFQCEKMLLVRGKLSF